MTSPVRTNRLINETSPYLLQHARNPVDWFPWGQEALERAKAEDMPILLSIGYSACHWCHVMEHESFENDSIAKLMNDNFVCIKVDREERPDLDNIYMSAVQMMTGQGGWPMTVFLTPDCVPFYGGTYYPPEDRYNMPGFRRVLSGIAEAYRQRSTDIEQTAKSILEGLRGGGAMNESDAVLNADVLDNAYRSIARSYDSSRGGFGNAPKFPAPMTLEFLLKTFQRTGDSKPLEMADFTCRKMAQGGIYDQLGGGFHRYSTDARWLVPHFEKMLYDNAQLVRVYLHLFQITRDEFYSTIVRETLDYVAREMTDPSGGFYSTQDADSEGHEGKFFVWTPAEISKVLSPEDAKIFCAMYDVTTAGNFEGSNILNIPIPAERVAETLGMTVEELRTNINRIRPLLFGAREHRVKPDRDEKILTSWNGLMIGAFAEAAMVLNDDSYLQIAINASRFVLDSMRSDGLLLRTAKDGKAKLNAYLEDYSFFADALLTLYEATGQKIWFDECMATVQTMIAEFWDEKEGGFYFTGASHEHLIVRTKDYFDNATPSGNSIAAGVLLKLAALTGDDAFTRRAVAIFRLLQDTIRKYPSGFSQLLCALDFFLSATKEIAIIGDPLSNSTTELKHEVWREYLPNKVVAPWDGAEGAAPAAVQLLANRGQSSGIPTAYVCEGFVCKQPATDVASLRNQLQNR